MYQLLHASLGLEAIALLYATFDKRIQANLISSRVGRHIEIEATQSTSHWHIMYYLKSIGQAESISIGRRAGVTSTGLAGLSDLQLRSLSLTVGSLAPSSHSKLPFMISSARLLADKHLKGDVSLLQRNLTVIASFPSFFPHLEHLYISTFFRNVASDPPMLADSTCQSIITSLPPTLKTFHHFEIVAWPWSIDKLPESLTDLRLSSTWHETRVVLGDFLRLLPNIAILHLDLAYNREPVEWSPWQLAIGDPKPYTMPPSLTELGLAIRPSTLSSLADPLVFPWKTSKIHLLRFFSTNSRQANLPSYELQSLFPHSLVELTIPSMLCYGGGKDSPLAVASFPRSLLTLNLGLMRWDTLLISRIAVLPHLQTLTIQISGTRPEPSHWNLLPKSLTHLDLGELTMGNADIINLPTGLIRLICHTPLFEDARAILDRCPNVKFTCTSEVVLLPLNMVILLGLGAEDLETITTYALLRYLYAYLGTRCTMDCLFDRTLGRTISGEKLLLSEKNRTIVMDSHKTSFHGYSLKGHHFSLQLVSWSKTLTTLEFQSTIEIANFKFVPPNLTVLNLRRSLIKNGVSMRDIPPALTSLTIGDSKSTIRASDLPARKQFVVLNTPSLSFIPQDVMGAISDSATHLACIISWISDKDIPKLLAPLQLSGATVAVDLVVRISGYYIPEGAEVIHYEGIYAATRAALIATSCVKSVEFLSPTLIHLPPTARNVRLLWNDPSPSNLQGFENTILPPTLVFLDVHLARGAQALISALPPTLRRLHLDSIHLAKDYIGKFPEGLEWLELTCQSDGNTKHEVNVVGAELMTFPRSLTCLKLRKCAPKILQHDVSRVVSDFTFGEPGTPEAEESARCLSKFSLLTSVQMHELRSAAKDSILFHYMPNASFEWLPYLVPPRHGRAPAATTTTTTATGTAWLPLPPTPFISSKTYDDFYM